jgi:tRNA nucleotidyltransferase (CCA-adding enzyme)
VATGKGIYTNKTMTINISEQIEKQLPAELVEFMQTAGLVAASQGQNLHLVGGVVRDLLLERNNFDLDLVVEGDAISLAKHLVDAVNGKITVHPRFNTANLQWDKWSIDLATARSETYEKPGALPKVQPGSLVTDLFRRDFTINTMAVELIPGSFGKLIDIYDGRNDLKHKRLRVLHENSFKDDATRIWRGMRYEQRLDFHFEADTLRLLKQDIPMLDTISGDRIRHELELVLKEELPEKVFSRADILGILARLHPSLKGDSWLIDKFIEARLTSLPLSGLYMALLAYRLNVEETGQLISYLRLRKSVSQILRDTGSLKSRIDLLGNPDIMSSAIYNILHGYSQTAITANSLATDSDTIQQHINGYLNRLRHVKPALTGKDLQKMGITPGPHMKEVLRKLHEARLDNKVTSRADEVEMVRGLI